MGGKSSTTQQSVTIPPDVLARYNSVNAQAQAAASQPFQQYSNSPDAFVAPINSTESAGIAGTTAAANQAQPYYSAATGQLEDAQSSATPYFTGAANDVTGAQAVGTGLAGASLGSLLQGSAAAAPLQDAANQNYTGAWSAAQPFNTAAQSGINSALAGAQPYQAGATSAALAGGQAVNPTTLDSAAINQYLSPYLNTVLGSTSALLNQNNQEAMAGQLGNAITSGAFGGDRSGIAAANLAQQQQLANANIYSGILNTGYGQALSTAQQQQGVDLSAGQANRAAQQGLSGQLQSIGNQGFTQGLGAATATGALGQQVYGQGMGLGTAQQGLGQQEYTQGANTAAQEAALGQQQFGQGITAANTTAGLGQDIYNTGANTSAALAGLGAGSQSAALQGSQAELAAGQVAQQTTQAGDTALYNQFLQQQSYPFQVDQFLANIAEGTGALSGSTTTTTQPGGFFSDERLKDDIEPIGKTFDGQNIIKFRYKGDPRKQIGLSAQEVERAHPDAVGLARGYRTVDYDKATADAAKRGHFADGGLAGAKRYAYGGSPILPGEWPSDLQAMMQGGQGGYAPYSAAGGLYGSPSGGAPRGGSSYVPQANLPVGHLAVAQGAPPAPPSGMDQINQIVKLAKGAQGGLNWSKNALQDLGGDAADNGDDPMWASRGGLARGKFALGGDPDNDNSDSDTGPTLDIPDDAPHAQLAVAGAPPPKPQSGFLGALGSLFDIGKDIAGVIPGLADGGSVDDSPPVAGPGNTASNNHLIQSLEGLGRAVFGSPAPPKSQQPAPSSQPPKGNRQGYDDGGDVSDGNTWMDPNGPVSDAFGNIIGNIGHAIDSGAHAAGNYLFGPNSPMQGAREGLAAAAPNDNSWLWSALGQTGLPAAGQAGANLGLAAHGPIQNGPVAPSQGAPAVAPPRPVRHLGTPAPAGLAGASTAPPPVDGPADLGPGAPVTTGDIANMMQSNSLTPPPDAGPMTPVNPVSPIAPPTLTTPTAPALSGTVDPTAGLPQKQGLGAQIESGLSGVGKALAPKGGYLDDVFHPSQDHGTALMSLLSGIAAMGTAPTRSLGVAAAAGLGAGTKAYGARQEQLANVAQTQAQARGEGASASAVNLANSKTLQVSAAMGRIRLDPQGPIVDPATGLRYSNTQQTPEGAAAPAAAAANYKYLGPNLAGAVPTASKSFIMDAPAGGNMNPTHVQNSEAMANDIQTSGAAAKTSLVNLNEQAAAIFDPARKGLLQQGALAPVYEPYVANWNATVQALGVPEASINGLGDVQIAHKLQLGQAAAQSSEAGQTALNALKGFEDASAGPGLDNKAAATLLAQQAVLATKASDRRDVLNEAQQKATSGNIETQPLMEAFDKDYTPETYSNMRDTLASLYQSPVYQTLRQGLASPPNSSQYQSAVATLDAFGQQKGIPRFSRVFTGE